MCRNTTHLYYQPKTLPLSPSKRLHEVLEVGHVAEPLVDPGEERLSFLTNHRAAAQLRQAAVLGGLERLPILELDTHEVLQAERGQLQGPTAPSPEQRKVVELVALHSGGPVRGLV